MLYIITNLFIMLSGFYLRIVKISPIYFIYLITLIYSLKLLLEGKNIYFFREPIILYAFGLELYLGCSQFFLGGPLNTKINVLISISYFIIAYFLFIKLTRKQILRISLNFIKFSTFFLLIECIWRLSNPNYYFDVNDPANYGLRFYIYKLNSIIFQDSNFVGIYVLITFFFGIYLVKYFKLKLKKYLIVLFVLCLFTFSRASIITLIGFALFIGIYRYLGNGNLVLFIKNNIKKIVVFSIVFLIILAISANFFFAGTSFSSKIEILRLTGSFMFENNIILNLFGVGFGNAYSYLGWGAHNFITTYYVESGLIGFLGVVIFLFLISKKSDYKNLIIIVPFLINGFSLTSHAVTYLYAVLAATCALEKDKEIFNFNEDKDEIKNQVEDVFSNKVILIFPSVVWSHNWERQHELIYRFSKKTNVKIYIISPLGFVNHNILTVFKKIYNRLFLTKNESTSNNPVSKNMRFVNIKLFIPIHNNIFIRKINSFLISRYIQLKYEELYEKLESDNDKVFWCTYPNETILDFIKKYKPALVVTDLAQRRKANKNLPTYVIKLEEKLVKESTLVFVDSMATKEDYKHIKDVYYFSQGVNIERNNVELKRIDELENITEPIVGYVGAMHECIDYELLEYLIKINSSLKFVFVGNIINERANILKQYSNVIFTGRKSFEEIPSYIKYFHIGLVPYLVNEYTQGISPTKLFEYGIQGIPVISTNLREVEVYKDTILIAKDKNEFNKNINKIINMDKEQLLVLKQRMRDISLKNSWDAKFEYFYNLLLKSMNGEN